MEASAPKGAQFPHTETQGAGCHLKGSGLGLPPGQATTTRCSTETPWAPRQLPWDWAPLSGGLISSGTLGPCSQALRQGLSTSLH